MDHSNSALWTITYFKFREFENKGREIVNDLSTFSNNRDPDYSVPMSPLLLARTLCISKAGYEFGRINYPVGYNFDIVYCERLRTWKIVKFVTILDKGFRI